jgi:hypothetical protein
VINERAISIYLEVLRQELAVKASELGTWRKAWQALKDQQITLKATMQSSLERAPQGMVTELEDWVRLWQRRNTEAQRLREEEIRLKSRIYDREVVISRLWRKQETLKRLMARQRRKDRDRLAFRQYREQQELITAGQPPP